MPFLRILQFVVGGLFLAALALFAVIAFGAAPGEQAVAEAATDGVPRVSVNPLTDDIEEELLADRPAGEGLSFVENLILTVTGRAVTAVEDAQAEAVLEVATLDRNHKVDIDQVVHLTDLMPPNLFEPPAVHRDMFAQAQAARYLRDRECPLLLADLAVACQVLNARVTPEEDNFYRIRAEIAFVAEVQPGEVPLAQNLRTQSEWFDVYDGRRPKRDRADHAEVLRVSYAQVVEQCAALRKTYGNCVVEEVEVRFRDLRGDPDAVQADVRVKASVVLPGNDS